LKARREWTLIRDKGYQSPFYGWSGAFPYPQWVDVQQQGVENDYCRLVGNSPNTFISCALAGAADEYTTETT
jgi:hypothetical protein